MKRGAPDHWKMFELGRLLGVPEPFTLAAANGYMERIWHFGAVYAPAGDIGQIPDEAIARACAWPADRAPELIEALVEARWLDRHQVHRLVVHDWSEHCDDGTHSKLARSKKFFADGKAPKLTGLRKIEADSARVYYATTAQPVATGFATTAQLTAMPSHSQAMPSHSHTAQPVADWLHADTFRTAWERHAKHRRDQPLEVVAQTLIGRGDSVNWVRIAEVHPRYAAYWAKRSWDFCPLSFFEWIDAGMPEPAPEAVTGPRALKNANDDWAAEGSAAV